MKKRKFVKAVIIGLAAILAGCSNVSTMKDNNISQEPLYKLQYESMFNALRCYPAVAEGVENIEIYINGVIRDRGVIGEMMGAGGMSNEMFELKIVSYNKDGEIIGEIIYNALIYNAENKEELGYIPENTEYLFVYNNINLKNIESLENVKGLRGLYIAYGKFLQDISPISGLSELEAVSFHNNELTDIKALESLAKLQILCIGENKVNDISSLQNLSKLRYLEIFGNQVENVSALSNLKQIQWINLGGNKVEDISPLSNLENLLYLNICGNNIVDYSSLDEAGIEYYRIE